MILMFCKFCYTLGLITGPLAPNSMLSPTVLPDSYKHEEIQNYMHVWRNISNLKGLEIEKTCIYFFISIFSKKLGGAVDKGAKCGTRGPGFKFHSMQSFPILDTS